MGHPLRLGECWVRVTVGEGPGSQEQGPGGEVRRRGQMWEARCGRLGRVPQEECFQALGGDPRSRQVAVCSGLAQDTQELRTSQTWGTGPAAHLLPL